MIATKSIKDYDFDLYEALESETKREQDHIELIASENYVSQAVLEAQGSIMTNKYAEGYPGHRYYGGCEFVDVAENLARDRVTQLFGAQYANVQPHSGSAANMAVYRTLLNKGDRILGMRLDCGGHLTHGSPLSFSGQDYECWAYGLSAINERLDYDDIRKMAHASRPRMIIAGASAYPRMIDFQEFRHIADDVGAFLFVDMAHIAGLVAAGLHENPVPYAHVVSSTTHKTLRGPRGGIILTNDRELGKRIDKNIFPGIQGGPLMHVIAAKAVAFKEALDPEFVEYSKSVVANAKIMGKCLTDLNYHVITGGTDNHLILVDVKSHTGLTGKKAEDLLGKVNITVNKNAILQDQEKPYITSGIRIGSAASTTRGFTVDDMKNVCKLIDMCLMNPDNSQVQELVKREVLALTAKYPLPYSI